MLPSVDKSFRGTRRAHSQRRRLAFQIAQRQLRSHLELRAAYRLGRCGSSGSGACPRTTPATATALRRQRPRRRQTRPPARSMASVTMLRVSACSPTAIRRPQRTARRDTEVRFALAAPRPLARKRRDAARARQHDHVLLSSSDALARCRRASRTMAASWQRARSYRADRPRARAARSVRAAIARMPQGCTARFWHTPWPRRHVKARPRSQLLCLQTSHRHGPAPSIRCTGPLRCWPPQVRVTRCSCESGALATMRTHQAAQPRRGQPPALHCRCASPHFYRPAPSAPQFVQVLWRTAAS